jgi:acyl-CoA dehydrogenase
MSDDDLLRATIAGLLRDERNREPPSPESAWRQLHDAGFIGMGLPESAGGSGGDLAAGAVLVRQCARFEEFSALPVGSTVLIGHWLRAAAGLPADLAPTVAAVASDLRIMAVADGYRVSGLVPRIVGARFASSLLIVARDPTDTARVISIRDRRDRPGVSIEPNDSHAPVALDDIVLDEVAVDSGSIGRLPAAALAALDLRIGLLATVHIAGLLDEVLDLTLRYAGERQQFGRPISAFQMVKEMIALLAAEVMAAGAAADGAVAAACADRDGTDRDSADHTSADHTSAELALRAAALRAGRAADIAARLAHQVHGTIGVTSEYPLHRYTTQLWHWRDAGRPRFESQLQLGRLLAARGPDGLWPAVAGS